ncbi:hypothetical protein [Salinimicrobium soli]
MENFKINGDGTCTLEVCEKKTSFNLEERVTLFLENMPTITKHWLHYKM